MLSSLRRASRIGMATATRVGFRRTPRSMYTLPAASSTEVFSPLDGRIQVLGDTTTLIGKKNHTHTHTHNKRADIIF